MKDTPIYARDLSADKRTDGFMGQGFEDLLRQAEKRDKDIIVGYYLDTPLIEG